MVMAEDVVYPQIARLMIHYDLWTKLRPSESEHFYDSTINTIWRE